MSEEKELIANTFKRFADEVVAPLAESIHREDLDIPEQIIGPAAEMGCFGTCIPERFGGLQPDDSNKTAVTNSPSSPAADGSNFAKETHNYNTTNSHL